MIHLVGLIDATNDADAVRATLTSYANDLLRLLESRFSAAIMARRRNALKSARQATSSSSADAANNNNSSSSADQASSFRRQPKFTPNDNNHDDENDNDVDDDAELASAKRERTIVDVVGESMRACRRAARALLQCASLFNPTSEQRSLLDEIVSRDNVDNVDTTATTS